MSDWFKGVNDGLLKLIRPDVSAPGLDSKARADRLDSETIDTELHKLWKARVLPEWSERQTKCLLLLWHDYIELSHHIADTERTTDFIYIHAIIHRRERDIYNSRFWFRHLDMCHIVISNIAKEVGAYLTEKGETQLLDRFVKDDGWVPLEFLEEVNKASKMDLSDPFVKLLQNIQTIEFACWFRFFCLKP
ncbi:MAG TPA: hypothetical protein PLW02_00920 [Verrucomicrobiota bacterium]|nr:hypothetical protein [Verrucomicrobiota bacterium]